MQIFRRFRVSEIRNCSIHLNLFYYTYNNNKIYRGQRQADETNLLVFHFTETGFK